MSSHALRPSVIASVTSDYPAGSLRFNATTSIVTLHNNNLTSFSIVLTGIEPIATVVGAAVGDYYVCMSKGNDAAGNYVTFRVNRIGGAWLPNNEVIVHYLILN